jgi:putative phage-type endonuclease
VVLGVSPFKTRWRLWAEKCGLAPEEDLSGNPHIRRGLEEEDRARRTYEDRHDVVLLPLCAESDVHPVMRASFDGLTDAGGPVELKCPSRMSFADLLEHGEGSAVFKRFLSHRSSNKSSWRTQRGDR